jgi:hypothetical protein
VGYRAQGCLHKLSKNQNVFHPGHSKSMHLGRHGQRSLPKKGTKQMYLSQPRTTPLHEGHARPVTNCQANAGDFSANPNLALSTSTRGPARVEAPLRSPTAARAQSVKQIKPPRSSLTAGLHHKLTEKWDAVADPGAQYCVHQVDF